MSRDVEELMYYAQDNNYDPDNYDLHEDRSHGQKRLNLEDWIEQHLTDITDAWSDIKEFREETGDLLFDACTFDQMCEAMYLASDKL
jgi:hypothetical protein